MKKLFRSLLMVALIFVCLICPCCATSPASVVERGAAWLSGSGDPARSAGEVGDYYLDFDTSSVYEKTESGWTLRGVLQPKEAAQQVKITFDANLGTLPPGCTGEVTVAKGESCELPVPVREGYTFVGWFFGDGANGGQANDLTVYVRDVSLTAKWRKLRRLTIVAGQASCKAQEEAFSFSGEYEGTDAAVFTVELEKDGVRRPATEENEWIVQAPSIQFSEKEGTYRGVLIFAEAGSYRLILTVEEADDRAQAIVVVNVTE